MPQPPADKPLGIPFIELQSVESTNNYARSLIKGSELPELPAQYSEAYDTKSPVPHGLTIFAHEQTAGKGQRGKTWTTEKSANIILSIVVNPDSMVLSGQFQLSACVAVGLHEFFQKYAGDETSIKWPNDLYWQDRKAGGVLIEAGVGIPMPVNPELIEGRESGVRSQEPEVVKWNWSIIGIGININQTLFPPELKNPVSLKQITGKNFIALELAKELCQILDKKYTQLLEEGFDGIYDYYLGHLYKRNEKVRLKKDNQVFEGIIKGVSKKGCLIVQHSIEEEFDFGTVEWML